MSYGRVSDVDLGYILEEGIKAALEADDRLRTTTTVQETGDGSNQLSSWSLTGVDFDNSESGVLYWKLANVASTRTVYLYSDPDKTSLVAQGSSVGDGTITLTERNSSGISGSAVVAYTADDDDANNKVSVNLLGITTILKEYVPIEEYDLWLGQCPLLTVGASRSAEARVAFGMRQIDFVCRIEVRFMGADMPTLRRKQKRVVDHVRSWLNDERTDGTRRFNGVLSTGDGLISEIDTEMIEGRLQAENENINAFVAAGAVTFVTSLHAQAYN